MLGATLINDRERTRYVENIILDAIRKKRGRVYSVLYAFLKIPKKKLGSICLKKDGKICEEFNNFLKLGFCYCGRGLK